MFSKYIFSCFFFVFFFLSFSYRQSWRMLIYFYMCSPHHSIFFFKYNLNIFILTIVIFFIAWIFFNSTFPTYFSSFFWFFFLSFSHRQSWRMLLCSYTSVLLTIVLFCISLYIFFIFYIFFYCLHPKPCGFVALFLHEFFSPK